MSSLQWVISYLCIGALVASGAMVFAAWSRKTRQSAHAVGIPAALAGAAWPLVLAGFTQWVMVYAIAKALRKQPERTSEVIYHPPPKVHAA